MNNLADRITTHIDSFAMGNISEYDLALKTDFEIHNWLNEQAEICVGQDLFTWLISKQEKRSNHG